MVDGSGRMLVTAVGTNSEAGVTMKLLGAVKSEKEQPSAQKDVTSTSSCIPVFVPKRETLDQSAMSDQTKSKSVPNKVVKGKSVLQEKLETLAKRIGYVGTTLHPEAFNQQYVLCLQAPPLLCSLPSC